MSYTHTNDDAKSTLQAVDIITPDQRGDLINALVWTETAQARLDHTDARTSKPRADLAKASTALRRVLGAQDLDMAARANGLGGD